MKWWLTIFVVFPSFLYSQYNESNIRCKWFLTGTAQYLDSMVVEPESIKADKNPVLSYDISTGLLQIPESSADSVTVCYRVFPIQRTSRYNRQYVENYGKIRQQMGLTQLQKQDHIVKRQLFHSENLTTSGNLSRSFSFGTNQDVFFNSQLDLQVNGKLTNDLNIRASISDRNVPYQPEGNTAQIQDFDRVFIEVYNDNISLIAGDVLFQHNHSHYLKYRKNVQGGLFAVDYDIGKSKAKSSIGFSMAQGKFASIPLAVIEGVQGPYRIPGPNGERFIVVISGSENVFLDGVKLERGYDRDYIIDYNTAEITFMNRVQITHFSRVRLDFEYAVQNYSRSIVHVNHQQQFGNSTFYTNFYSEKDNENRPLLFDLSDEEKSILSELGDNQNQVFVPSIDSVGFNQNEILYKLIDTVDLDGNYQEVLVFSTNPDSANYRATFTEVGFNMGDYILANTQINGRVFVWVSPQNGISQGNYSPQEVIALPNKKNLWNVGGNIGLTEYEHFRFEVALSQEDLNLFSEMDDDDNSGQAYLAEFSTKDRSVSFLNNYKWSSSLNYQFTDRNFQFIDRFREIEFDRDWNYSSNSDTSRNDDHIIKFESHLRQNTSNEFLYSVTRRMRGERIDGWQQDIRFSKSMGRWLSRTTYFQLENNQGEIRSSWDRLKTNVEYDHKIITPGYVFQFDKNQNTTSSDSVVSTLNNFQEHLFYLESHDTLKTTYRIDYSIREDKIPLEGQLIRANLSRTLNLTANSNLLNHRLGVLFSYKENENLTNDTTLNLLEKNIKINGLWRGTLLNNHVNMDLNYGASNGRELRREFVFFPVNQGEGTHAWRDLNEDGVQDLNEFFEALNPDEGNFIKVFTPTDEYIIAFTNSLDFRFNGQMPEKWREATGVKKILGRLSNMTTWRLERRTTDPGAARFNPFDRSFEDENLLSLRENFRSSFFYDRGSRKFNMEGAVVRKRRKQLISQGFDSRNDSEIHWEGRYGISRSYFLGFRAKTASKEYQSDLLLEGDFIINGYEMAPELSWQPNAHFRLTGRYVYSTFENILSEIPELSLTNEYNVELRYTKSGGSSINATVRYLDINFEGTENSPAGYELLQALQPGKNTTININWQRFIGKAILLNLTYNGRKSPSTDFIQFGRIQVSALF